METPFRRVFSAPGIRRILVTGGVAALALGLLIAIPPSAAVADPGDPCAMELDPSLVSLDVSTGHHTGEFGAWDTVRVDFSASIPSEYCSGSTITVELPNALRTQGHTVTIVGTNDSGEQSPMATMIVTPGSAGTATLTFDSGFLEANNFDRRVQAFVESEMTSDITPGSNYVLEFEVGGVVVRETIPVRDCPNCNAPRSGPGKWAAFNSDATGERIYIGIESQPIATADELVSVTDVLTSPGQEIRCGTVGAFVGALNQWGGMDVVGSARDLTVNCDPANPTTFTASARGNAAGDYVVFTATLEILDVPGQTIDEWTDEASVRQAGSDRPTAATARRSNAGGFGSGANLEAPAKPLLPGTGFDALASLAGAGSILFLGGIVVMLARRRQDTAGG